jgi:hypothetical protein
LAVAAKWACAVLPDTAGTNLYDVVMAKVCPAPTPSKEDDA